MGIKREGRNRLDYKNGLLNPVCKFQMVFVVELSKTQFNILRKLRNSPTLNVYVIVDSSIDIEVYPELYHYLGLLLCVSKFQKGVACIHFVVYYIRECKLSV
jgi:hypothetical protein